MLSTTYVATSLAAHGTSASFGIPFSAVVTPTAALPSIVYVWNFLPFHSRSMRLITPIPLHVPGPATAEPAPPCTPHTTGIPERSTSTAGHTDPRSGHRPTSGAHTGDPPGRVGRRRAGPATPATPHDPQTQSSPSTPQQNWIRPLSA